MKKRFRIHRRIQPVRKIYQLNFLLIFLFFALFLAVMIYPLNIDTLLLRLLKSSAFTFFVTCLFFLLASALVSYYALRELFNILEKLSEATRKIAKGDYTVRLDSRSSIAEVEDMTQSFNQMAEQLSSVEMLRKNFIADVSHEFKTPLSSITGYVTLLQDPDLTEAERDEYIKMAIFNAEKLNDLTDSILRLSRLENQVNLPDPVTYRLDEQIREAIVLLERKWNERNILLDIDLQEVQYCGQKNLLLQVWINLISNAIKFSNEGGRIYIHLSQVTGGIHAVIRDSGIGMDEKTRAHIFEKFYQGDTSRRSQGNGLGLALCKEIIDRCGGEIFVSSQPGMGSVFTVILPDSVQN